MTMKEPTIDSTKTSSRHLLVLAGAVACGFLVALAASELFDDGSQRQGLRSGKRPVTANSLQSWLSFNKQTGAFGLTEIEVERIPPSKSRQKVMELKDPNRMDVSSNDEEVIVRVVEHKDPDLSESGKDEFELMFQGNDQEFDQKDIEAALSKALRSGLRDADQISKAVSDELNHGMKKTSTQHVLPQKETEKDKP